MATKKTEDDLLEELAKHNFKFGKALVKDILVHLTSIDDSKGPISVQEIAQDFIPLYTEFCGFITHLILCRSGVWSWKDLGDCYKFLVEINWIGTSENDDYSVLEELDKTKPLLAYVKEMEFKNLYDGTSISDPK